MRQRQPKKDKLKVLSEVSTNISTSKQQKKKQPGKKTTRSATTSTAAQSQVEQGQADLKAVKKVELQPVKKTRVISHDDLDADDINDPMMVSEYVVEIFTYLKELEVSFINS